MIGSLLYLMASRPDIMFNVCLCVHFQEDPKTSHLEAVKRIFRYIKGTMHLGLRYPKGTSIETVVYADSDHAGDYVDRKSTSGIYTFVGCCLTSWFSKKQIALAISTNEAKYVSAGKACQQALWMKQALIDYDIRLDDVPIIQYHFKYALEGQMLIEFVIQNQFFSYTLKEFGQIFGIRIKGECSFTDKWSLHDLLFSVPKDGPYQTNPPSPNEIKNYVQEEREGPVTRRNNLGKCLLLRGNQDHVPACLCHMLYCIARTSRASTPFPTRFVNSLTNEVPRVFSNPPNIDPNMELFYSRQTKILNRQLQLRDEQRGGIRSIGKGIKNLWRKEKK
ncbi:hypothetical protein Tco_0394272 [Tanacetum coccineum]